MVGHVRHWRGSRLVSGVAVQSGVLVFVWKIAISWVESGFNVKEGKEEMIPEIEELTSGSWVRVGSTSWGVLFTWEQAARKNENNKGFIRHILQIW